MREIEIKVKVNNPKVLEEKLKEQKCVLSEPIRQHDVIYALKGSVEEFENAKEGDIIPRIRRFGKIAQFNLKQQCSGEMDNEEVREELFQILESLGLSRESEETRGYDTQLYYLRK